MASSIGDRVRRYRESLRRAGLRPVQIWVPDARRPGFAAECRRQSARLKDDPQEREILAWTERAADDKEWE